MSSAEKWVESEIIMLGKINQVQKDKYNLFFSQIWIFKKMCVFVCIHACMHELVHALMGGCPKTPEEGIWPSSQSYSQLWATNTATENWTLCKDSKNHWAFVQPMCGILHEVAWYSGMTYTSSGVHFTSMWDRQHKVSVLHVFATLCCLGNNFRQSLHLFSP